jgi:hypothetical protein
MGASRSTTGRTNPASIVAGGGEAFNHIEARADGRYDVKNEVRIPVEADANFGCLRAAAIRVASDDNSLCADHS